MKKWAEKNDVQGDMNSWCTNEVQCASFFSGKSSATSVPFLAGTVPEYAYTSFCGGQELPRTKKSLSVSSFIFGGKCSQRSIRLLGGKCPPLDSGPQWNDCTCLSGKVCCLLARSLFSI